MTTEAQCPKFTGNVPFVLTQPCRTATEMPDLIAVIAGTEKITYRDLDATAAGIYETIVATDVPRGEFVALYFKDRWLNIPAMLACMAAGNPFVPLGWDIPAPRLREFQRVVRFKVVLSDDPAVVGSALPSGTSSIQVRQSACSNAGLLASVKRGRSPITVDDAASIYFTSGSTGSPKAIVGRMKGVDAFIKWEAETVRADRGVRVSQLASPSFDGFLKDVFVPLCFAGTVVIPEDPGVVCAPVELASWVRTQHVQVLHLVPSVLRKFLHDISPASLPDLRALVLAGEALRPADLALISARLGHAIQVLNLYGPTETTLTKLSHQIDFSRDYREVVPIGRPMPETEVELINQRGEPCEPGEVGEIILRTPYASLGYHNSPELTAAAFDFSSNDGRAAYKTGDLGRRNARGEYEFVGRVDNQIKINGVRVEPEEIERLVSKLPLICEVAVVATENQDGGHSLSCWCTVSGPCDENDIRECLLSSIPGYMMPSTIKIVGRLPTTQNGKIDRRALIEESSGRRVGPGGTSAIGGELSDHVADLYSKILGVQEIDRSLSFFVQGGHSMLAVELLASTYKNLGVKLTMRDLFENSSPMAFAAKIHALRGEHNA